MEGKPTLFVIAGPEGSGKTTFYEQSLEAQQRLGPQVRRAPNLEIAGLSGRDAGDKGYSVLVETSLAQQRDLDQLKQAKDAGYRVVLFHVQTQSADLNVARVAERVNEGGRGAPEATVRAEYAKSPQLIAEAAKIADRTFVYDNSALNEPPKHVLSLERGRVSRATQEIPNWVREAYGQQLAAHREANVSPAERSFAEAVDKAEQRVPGAKVQIAGYRAGDYQGPVVDGTRHHVLQQTGEKEFTAHFKDRLAVVPQPGQAVTLRYGADRDLGKVEYQPPSKEPAAARNDRAQQFLKESHGAAERSAGLQPEHAAYDALRAKASEAAPRNEQIRGDVENVIRRSIASRIQAGTNIEVSRGQVDAVQYQVASRSLDSAIEEKQTNPLSTPRIDPEHRRIIVERSDRVARQVEGKVTTIEPETQAFKEATRIAAQLARHDGGQGKSPFASRELSGAYRDQQSKLTNELQRAQQRGNAQER